MEQTQSLKSHAALLKFISSTDTATQRRVLKLADKRLIAVICEVCYNTLQGVVRLREREKKILGKHKTHLRLIAARGECWKQKKKRLLQSGGGFLTAVLAPLVATALGALLRK
jgi:hypothetical protein